MPLKPPNTVPNVSFEFFPPNSDKGEGSFWPRVDRLAGYRPAFMTMTYGAGGSARDRTVDLAIQLYKRTGIPSAAHLTCIATPKKELHRIADKLWDNGIRHIVALRGDLSSGMLRPDLSDNDYFHYTSDFVQGLKAWHPFEISVGAYPEKHPDAPDLSADIEALRKKCEAGADRAITQFFFDNNLFYKFRDELVRAGIHTTLIPGILPIVDYDKMLRFARTCQATVPPGLMEKFEKVKDNPEAMKVLSADIVTAQVMDLASEDVRHLHFYTLNQSSLVIKACEALGLQKH